MIREEKKLQEVVTQQVFCDVCGVNTNKVMYGPRLVCAVCGDDLCEDCVGATVGSVFLGNEEKYCAPCWKIGEEYRKKMKKYQDKIDELQDEWTKKCRP